MFQKGLYLFFDLGYQLHLISIGNSLSDADVLDYNHIYVFRLASGSNFPVELGGGYV
jgi:hypothetical protein